MANGDVLSNYNSLHNSDEIYNQVQFQERLTRGQISGHSATAIDADIEGAGGAELLHRLQRKSNNEQHELTGAASIRIWQRAPRGLKSA